MPSSLTYKEKWFADGSIARLSFEAGLGHARAIVGLRLHPHHAYMTIPATDRPSEIRFTGWLSTGQQAHIADLSTLFIVWATNDHPMPVTENLYGTVTFRELELLHERRPPGDAPLRFSINLEATASGSRGPSHAGILQLPFEIPASDWRIMLGTAGHTKFFTIEIPLEGESVLPALRPAAAKLKEAIDHRNAGHWQPAVAACREVLELLDDLVNTSEPNVAWAQLAERDTREAMGLAERLRLMRMSLRQPTHLAHHSADVRFSRADATYIVDVTSAVIKYYNERLR